MSGQTTGMAFKANGKAYHNSSIFNNLIKYKYLYLLLLPGLLWVITFRYIPIYGLTMAFKNFQIFKGLNASPWVGLEHFQRLFTDRDFIPVLRNTLLISLYKIVIGFPVPIILALLMNEVKNIYFKKTVQTVIYFPHFLSWVIVSGLITLLLSPDGIVNALIRFIGGDAKVWLAQPLYFRGILVASSIWKEAGWGTVMYMAAIAGIDAEMYEASLIDGATRFQRLVHITLPCLIPTIMVLFILRLGNVMEAGFEETLLFLNPSVMRVGDILDTFTYRVGLEQAQYSYSTAVGLFKSVVNMMFVLGANWLSRKAGQESLF